MGKIHNIFIFILILWSWSSGLYAASADSLSITIENQEVSEKSFVKNPAEKYTEKDFDYETMEGTSQNLIARFINWFFNLIQKVFGIEFSPNTLHTIETIFYILLSIGAVYLIVKLLFGKEISAFKKKENPITNWIVDEETVESTNIDALIDAALKSHNYRLAVRYLHLKTLHTLGQAKLIDLHFEKTNSDYQKELKAESLKSDFARASYLYDYIWYGEFAINQTTFEGVHAHFDNLLKNIERHG